MLVVIDTNVLVAGLRSKFGASNALLSLLAMQQFRASISTALCMEYTDVLHRPGLLPHYSQLQIDTFIDSFCSLAKEAANYFRWRPFLPDPKDDLVLECALASGATHIITHNLKDFSRVEELGIFAVTPQEFMRILHPL